MPLTHKKSVTRLPSKKEPSTVCDLSFLDPAGEKNFFEFYKKHTAPVDEIVSAQIGVATYGIDHEDEKDLRQDVLFRLHRCNILGRYNPGKSAFNTYLTNTIKNYVKSWVKDKKINEHHSWQPWPTQKLYEITQSTRENLKVKIVPYASFHFNAKIVFENLNVGAEILGVETRENGPGTSVATRVQIDGLSSVKSFSVLVPIELESCSDKRYNYKIVFKGIETSFSQQGLQIRSSETTSQNRTLAIRASLKKLPCIEPLRYEREYYPSMNGVNFSVVENSKDICFDPGIEEEYSINEMLSLLRKGIPEKLVPFLDVLTEGLNRNEIEELFSISYWELQGRISQLQKYGRKILKDKPSF